MAIHSQRKAAPWQYARRGFQPRQALAGFVLGVCFCLVSAGRAATGSSPVVADYQHAVESFNRGDYDAAAALLDKLPDAGNAKDRADVLNLHGAVCLHQKHFEQALQFFSRARQLDPGFWAANFNEAEVYFQEKKYGESRREFADLLAKTPSASRPSEFALVEYKTLLSSLLIGNDKPVRAYLAAHAKDAQPPASYFFLHAALENSQSHQHEAGQWLVRAGAIYSPVQDQPYTETFAQLGWPTPRADVATLSAMKGRALHSPQRPGATLAVVQLLPGGDPSADVPAKTSNAASVEKPAFRYGGPMAVPLPAEQPTEQNAPPAPGDELKVAPNVPDGMMVGSAPVASDLARHRSTPTPSPSPSASPDTSDSDSSAAATASPAGSASPGAASTASPAPSAAAPPDLSATPGGSASPAFVQKYEAAYVKFIQKDYDGAKVLLTQAEAIQPNQPSATALRGQIFKHYYEAAYVDYLKSDYVGAIAQLDSADGVQPKQPDASNLRGLVFSRQHKYDEAEDMFKKAIQADPTFWAAKFNLAELPFNYRNYTAARARFEDLFSQTDPVKQPREAELTQFKVFLTLLLEGKEAGARSFMEHFTFSGTTPARYFCQSALDFYHGDVDKATGWLDSAKKEYPAQLVSIFIESFYRVGWMTDPSAHAEVASAAPGASAAPIASAGTGATPGTSPAGSPAAAALPSSAPVIVAAATPGPSAVGAGAKPTATVAGSPNAVVAASPAVPAPVIVAAATPGPSAVGTGSKPAATPAGSPNAMGTASQVATAPIIVAKPPTPTAVPAKVVSVPVPATPAPSAPLIAGRTATGAAASNGTVAAAPSTAVRPSPSPSPVIAAAKPTPLPSASVAVVAKAPSIAPAFTAEPVRRTGQAASPAPTERAATPVVSPAENVLRYMIVIVVVGQMAFAWARVGVAFKNRAARQAGSRGFAPKNTVEPDEVQAPR